MVEPLAHAIAFLGGLGSFFAPCALALVPVWLTYVMGTGAPEPRPGSSQGPGVPSGPLSAPPKFPELYSRLLKLGLFAAGFTVVFVLLGTFLGGLSQWLWVSTEWLNRMAGFVLIVMGLAHLDLLPISSLRGNWRPLNPHTFGLNAIGAFFVGVAFAVGWTPCVGPVLGSILVLAGASGSAVQGGALLFSYSLGLMIPFFIAGFAADRLTVFFRRSGWWLRWVTPGAGVLLIVLGIATFTGLLPLLLSWFPAPQALRSIG